VGGLVRLTVLAALALLGLAVRHKRTLPAPGSHDNTIRCRSCGVLYLDDHNTPQGMGLACPYCGETNFPEEGQ
jgi:hypothetical protein